MSMSSLSGSRTSTRTTSSSAVVGKSLAIHYWAAVGAFFVLLQIYIFARWLGSDGFAPTPPGSTPLPDFQRNIMWLFQATFPFFILAGWGWIAWQARREGRLPAFGLVMLGWASVYWQDPLINYVRPSFSYSSHWINFGSWCEFVPGWLSPNGSKMPEPLLFGAGAYAVWVPIGALMCLGWMRVARRVMPSINTLGLLVVALFSMFVTDLIAEGTMVLTGVYAYLGVIHSLSLFDGQLHQFPLYESLLGGGAAAATGSLLYFRDDKGNMLVERGVENLQRKRGTELLRVLAVSGFVNVAVMTYTVLFIVLNLHMDAFPNDTPSWLLNGVCGKGTDYECPGPDVHIPLRSSGPLSLTRVATDMPTAPHRLHTTPAGASPMEYVPVGQEVELFSAAYAQNLPVLLKGPTGVGKTRFVEHMAERLGVPLITVPCHEDLTAADLVGRYLLQGSETVWVDGPLTRAMRSGAICYLDEVVEARADTIVVLHPLMDHRRELHIERLGQSLRAPDSFMLVLSYNPGYQSLMKDLKASTRQRMVAIDFAFPPAAVELRVLGDIYQIERGYAERLVRLAQAIRRLDEEGLSEAASTRALVSAGKLHRGGLSERDAAIAAIASPLSDDEEVRRGLVELIDTYLT